LIILTTAGVYGSKGAALCAAVAWCCWVTQASLRLFPAEVCAHVAARIIDYRNAGAALLGANAARHSC